MRLRELLIKRNEYVGEAYRIGEYVESLMQKADEVELDQFCDISHEIEENRARVEAIMSKAHTARPQILAEIERIIDVLGEKAVLDELSKHPFNPIMSVN
ncbi:MAG: hypothetical protein OEU36_03480 [Gammaproteobacteria bacterium]|nr:hypothetical protein [Gammaproteobacteria bacterium]